MSKFTQEDLTRARDAFRAVKAQVMDFAFAWHAQLEAGIAFFVRYVLVAKWPERFVDLSE